MNPTMAPPRRAAQCEGGKFFYINVITSVFRVGFFPLAGKVLAFAFRFVLAESGLVDIGGAQW
jgi:hypothetical protein